MSNIHRDSFSKYTSLATDVKPLEKDILMTTDKPKLSFWKRFSELMDFSLLNDPPFLNLLLGLSLFYVAEMNFKMVTPFFLASLGYTKTDIAFCLSMAAISDIAARLIIPPIGDRLKIKKRYVFFVSIVFVGITRSSMYSRIQAFTLK